MTDTRMFNCLDCGILYTPDVRGRDACPVCGFTEFRVVDL